MVIGNYFWYLRSVASSNEQSHFPNKFFYQNYEYRYC
jgi:hypothetical protein